MRFIYILFCLSIASSALAINIKTNRIVFVSDSILVSKVGEHLKEYFEISETGTHYKYLVSNNKIATDQFYPKKKLLKMYLKYGFCTISTTQK